MWGLTGKVEYELVNAYEKFTKFTKGTKGPQGCVPPAGGATVCDTQNARPLYRSLEPWHVHVEGSRTHTCPILATVALFYYSQEHDR
jgi:hypothetical protein